MPTNLDSVWCKDARFMFNQCCRSGHQIICLFVSSLLFMWKQITSPAVIEIGFTFHALHNARRYVICLCALNSNLPLHLP